MIRTTHGSTRTDTLSPYTTLFRSGGAGPGEYDDVDDPAGRTLRRRVDDAGNAVQGQSRPARPGAGLVARAIEAARPRLPRDARSDAVSAIPTSCRPENGPRRSEEPPSELQSLMRITYSVFLLTTQN